MSYTHRNGETEPPTIEGFYWLREGKEGGSIISLSWQEEIPDEYGIAGYPARFEVWVIGSEVEIKLDQLDDEIEWWGPIVPPWESLE